MDEGWTRRTRVPRTGPGRRRFLAKATMGVAAASAALVAPNVSRAQSATWRFQCAWPRKDFLYEIAADYVRRVNEMANGRLKLELLPAGTVAGAYQMLDAISGGNLDGGHAAAAFWNGKNKAFTLFGSAPPYFTDANHLLGWFRYGGGESLYNELLHDIAKVNVLAFPSGPMPTQPLGWFKKEIASPEDFKELKFRVVGLAGDMFREMGVTGVVLPGGEVVPALERGQIDGAEYNNPTSDRAFGYPEAAKIYMIRSFHQCAECLEVVFNRGKFEALPTELKAVLRHAADASSADMSWRLQDRYPRDLDEMTSKQGVVAVRTPDSVLEAQIHAWQRLLADLTKDPFFKKVVDSQMAWARRIGGFLLDYEAPAALAYDQFFKKS